MVGTGTGRPFAKYRFTLTTPKHITHNCGFETSLESLVKFFFSPLNISGALQKSRSILLNIWSRWGRRTKCVRKDALFQPFLTSSEPTDDFLTWRVFPVSCLTEWTGGKLALHHEGHILQTFLPTPAVLAGPAVWSRTLACKEISILFSSSVRSQCTPSRILFRVVAPSGLFASFLW